MIVDLLALLIILAACTAVAIMFTIRLREHQLTVERAKEDHLAEDQELYAAWARIHAQSHGRQEPSGVDPRDRMLI